MRLIAQVNPSVTKLSTWLKEASGQLTQAGITTARLDCLVLLEDATGKDRAWLLANPDHPIQGSTLATLNEQVTRRAKHEPLAYIRGKTEFYGRGFLVSPDTLEPRPESETMIELLKNLVKTDEKLILADIGTGSGALAITTKLERPQLEIVATEISATALKIAKQNAKKLNADIEFFEGNLLEPLSILNFKLSIITTNLPYVPNKHTVNQAAMQEPRIAIFGGSDGLDLYRQMFTQIGALLFRPKYVLTESLPPQHSRLADIASQVGYVQKTEDDFIQVFQLSTGSALLPTSQSK